MCVCVCVCVFVCVCACVCACCLCVRVCYYALYGFVWQMKPDIQQYFSDPIESFRKQQKTLLQILEFQKKHRDRFINHLKESVSVGAACRHGHSVSACYYSCHISGILQETRNQQLMQRVSHLEK